MGLIMQNGISYGGVDIVKLTQAEYDALPESKYTDGILYAITDGESSSGGGSSKPVELTKAQYEALGDSVLNDNILYAITDGDELSAKNLEYDGSETGLGNNVQDAIDELNSNIGKDENGMTVHEKLDNLKQVIKEDFTCVVPVLGVNSWWISNGGSVTVFRYTNENKYKYLKATSVGNFGAVIYGDSIKLVDQTSSLKTEVILEIENISEITLKHSQSGVASGNVTLIFTDSV